MIYISRLAVRVQSFVILIILHKKIKKALQHKAKGLGIVWLPRQNDFRNFCMNEETEEIYCKLEEVIGICK